ncbi:MAG: flagellar hook assembly protein FlgD [Verrucomicrobia bacterium]|nr:flagellar hook assembly protein FlgD [Verrucomicrobiota bacterium]
MSAVSAISSTKTAAATDGTDTTSTASRVPQKTLGQNDFLKLLAKQFQTQDPMKPMEDTAFIAQMAQFSSLEQTKTMTADMAALRSDQQRTAANSYLGHRVTVDDGKKGTAVGDVTAVDARGTEPQLVINGVSYPLSSVLLVEPGSLTTPQPVSSTGA